MTAAPLSHPMARTAFWAPDRWPLRLALALGIFALALGLRLRGLDAVPWYGDEGDTAEVALSLAQGRPPAVGAIKQNAFFPLSTSPIAPWFASLALRAQGGEALPALRRWSVCLGALEAALLCLVLWFLAGPAWGLGAGLLLAVEPLAVALQQMGFYQHLGALTSVGALGLLAWYWRRPSVGRGALLGLACGLCVATAYWLAGLLLLAPMAAWLCKRPKDAWPALLLSLLPLGLVAAWSWSVDSAGFWGDVKTLAAQTSGAVPDWARWIRPVAGFYRAGLAFPSLWPALAGLLAWPWVIRTRPGAPGAGLAVLLWSVLCCAEPFRQRQNLEGFPYPLILALAPMAAGMSALFLLPWAPKGRQRWLLRAMGLVAVGLCLAKVPDLGWIRRASLPADEAHALINGAAAAAKPGDLVFGQAPFNWALEQRGYRATDLDQAAAWEGLPAAFLRPDLPKSRFTFDPRLEDAKLLVFTPLSWGLQFQSSGPRSLGLRAEQQRWGVVWSAGDDFILANPAQGGPRAPGPQYLLRYFNLYDLAALDAWQRHDFATARYALQVALSSKQGDMTGRQALLDRVDQALRQSQGASR